MVEWKPTNTVVTEVAYPQLDIIQIGEDNLVNVIFACPSPLVPVIVPFPSCVGTV